LSTATWIDDGSLTAVAARSPWQIARSKLAKDRIAIVSGVFIILLALFALFAPLTQNLTSHEQGKKNFKYGVVKSQPAHPFTGCKNGIFSVGDESCMVFGAANTRGNDMLVELAFGARTSLQVGVIATVLTMIVAVLIGLVAGFFGGLTDLLLSRLMDLVAAFPYLLFAIAMSVAFGASMTTVIAVIVFFSWFYPARIFRSDVLSLREREYVSAARMLGAGNWRIMRKHLLPHLLGPIIVYGSLTIGAAIGFEAALSFLGFGLPPDKPSWGRMVSDAAVGGNYRNHPHLMLFPGSLLFLTVLAFNLLGDALRDTFDPHTND
jgi:ABC-type dipeptide/oligopeptide/nickel transport system permease subunit